MPNGSSTGLARLVAACRNSARGVADIWRLEEAFRIEIAAAVLSVPVAGVLGTSLFQSAVLVSSVLLIVLVEVLNSAIETTVDRIGAERHELSRIAKDLGSLAVLLAVIIAALIWAGAILDRLV